MTIENSSNSGVDNTFIKDINNGININSELGEIFSNRYFLIYFLDFIDLYEQNINNTDSLDPADKAEAIEYVRNLFADLLVDDSPIEQVDVEYIFKGLLDLFSEKSTLASFLSFVSHTRFLKRDKFRKEYNKMLKVCDYLYTKFSNTEGLPKKDVSDILKNELKLKVGDVLLNKTNNIEFKLAEKGFPLLVNNYNIFDADFENVFRLGDDIIIQVQFEDDEEITRKLYINKKGKIFKSREGVIIEKIHYITVFAGISFMKFTDVNNNQNIEATSTSGKYFETKFDDVKVKKIIHNGNIFNYLITTSYALNENNLVKNFNQIFSEDISQVGVLDILKFLNNGNRTSFAKPDEFYNSFDLSDILEIKIIDGITFISLGVYNGDGIKCSIVLNEDGNILLDGDEYISKVYSLENMLGKKFIQFGDKAGSIDGCFDLNYNVLKIPFEYVIKVDNTQIGNKESVLNSFEKFKSNKENADFYIENTINLDFNPEDIIYDVNILKIEPVAFDNNFYVLNDNRNLIIRKENLEKHLSKYKSFGGVIDTLEINFEKNANFSIMGKQVEKLYVDICSGGEFHFSYSKNKKDYIEQEIVFSELNKTKNGKAIISFLEEKVMGN